MTRQCSSSSACSRGHYGEARRWRLALLAALVTFFFVSAGASANPPKPSLKPTELVIRQFEKFVADGSLLSAAGWKRASAIFANSDPYPADGEIRVMSVGSVIGEDWVNGDHAQVETKWGDSYGRIDSSLKFKADPYGTLPTMITYSLVFVPLPVGAEEKGSITVGGRKGQWRMDGPPRIRSATIPAAIQYLEAERDKSADPVLRRNANRTIATLKRLTGGCGSASAC